MQHIYTQDNVTEYHDAEGLVFGGALTQIDDIEEELRYTAYDLNDEVWSRLIKEGMENMPNQMWAYALLRHGQPWKGQGAYYSLPRAWEQYQNNTAPRWIRRKINQLKKELGVE